METTDKPSENTHKDSVTKRPSLFKRLRRSFTLVFRRKNIRKRTKSDSNIPGNEELRPHSEEIGNRRASLTLVQTSKRIDDTGETGESSETNFRPLAKVPITVNSFTSELKQSLQLRSRQIEEGDKSPTEAINQIERLRILSSIVDEDNIDVKIETETKTFEAKVALFEGHITVRSASVTDTLKKDKSEPSDIVCDVNVDESKLESQNLENWKSCDDHKEKEACCDGENNVEIYEQVPQVSQIISIDDVKECHGDKQLTTSLVDLEVGASVKEHLGSERNTCSDGTEEINIRKCNENYEELHFKTSSKEELESNIKSSSDGNEEVEFNGTKTSIGENVVSEKIANSDASDHVDKQKCTIEYDNETMSTYDNAYDDLVENRLRKESDGNETREGPEKENATAKSYYTSKDGIEYVTKDIKYTIGVVESTTDHNMIENYEVVKSFAVQSIVDMSDNKDPEKICIDNSEENDPVEGRECANTSEKSTSELTNYHIPNISESTISYLPDIDPTSRQTTPDDTPANVQ